jgi:flavodoxin
MKTLIVYDSNFGNTKQIALTLAEVFQHYGYAQPVPVAEASHLDKADWDLLILGGPTQNHRISPALNALVRALPRRALQGRYATAFDTRYQQARWLSGSAAMRLAQRLQRAGAKLLLPPESFFVEANRGPLIDGEVKRASIWAAILGDLFQEKALAQPKSESALG